VVGDFFVELDKIIPIANGRQIGFAILIGFFLFFLYKIVSAK
jgi:hypothetical protein